MGGRDISEIHRTGGNFVEYLDKVRADCEPVGFRPSLERLVGEDVKRIEEAKRVLGFGVKFLDKALGGIAPNDLIILGGKTGRGKTELASLIALFNTALGRIVHYLALEAEDLEIERRLKYKLLAQLVASHCIANVRRRMNYLDWRYGRLEHITRPFEAEVAGMLTNQLGTLRTLYRGGEFDLRRLQAIIREIKDETDLVVIDHLNYVDTVDPNENRGFKDIIKAIRDVALEISKPVIAIAHVRKGDRKTDTLVPNEEDFHGTSDVPKIATKAIMIAPAFKIVNDVPFLLNTFMRAVKCRPDGERTRYCGLVAYNARTGTYEEQFRLGRLTNLDTEFEELPPDKFPPWTEDYDAEVLS